jgi:hypothetical protein
MSDQTQYPTAITNTQFVSQQTRLVHVQDVVKAIFNQFIDMLWTIVGLPAMHRSTRSKASGDSAQVEALFGWISAIDVANDCLALALPSVEGYNSRLLTRFGFLRFTCMQGGAIFSSMRSKETGGSAQDNDFCGSLLSTS